MFKLHSLFVVVAGASLFSMMASAQSPKPAFSSCEKERVEFCSDRTAPDSIFLCLMGKRKDLSAGCKDELQRLLQEKQAAEEQGGGALTSFGGANAFGPPVPLFSYEGHLIPAQASSKSEFDNRFNLSLPVYKSEGNSLAVSVAGSTLRLGENLQLSDGRAVSSDWNREEVGVQYTHQEPDATMWSVKGAAGYSGDASSPLMRDLSYSFVGTYGYAAKDGGYWVWLLFASNNSPLGNYVPIPGVMYVYKSEHVTALLGFPVLSVQWTPVDPWAFSVSAFGPTIQGEVSYKRYPAWQTFFSYGYVQQSFIPENREQDRDRMIIQEQKIGPGVRIPIGHRALLELQAGWSYDRSMYIKTSGVLGKPKDVDSLGAGAFGNLALKYAF